MGLGLLLLGCGESVRRIRDCLGGLGPPEEHGWRTLRRWGQAVRDGTLFSRLPALALAEPRRRAARAAAILSTHAPPSLARASAEAQVFSGAVVLAQAA